ncbi:ComEA family DNA-binding protein [Desulfoluna butyratoxydans]|uniref:Helix-hairpin-helix motif n=1 Tax=Desulfoluna butyratoxydans TaxID=231438 RepID=A0A4U8YZT4_9BACT|nr:helix-hairpin-helix domain-containing protein [Desulfoluna butyratoxydans]VFQ47473.1 helix-hairpin-helix motif [Desulfoluna butyratoxydans]
MKRFTIVACTVIALMFAFSVYTFASVDKTVNINTASIKELSSLKRIGEKVSQRIVDYRESVGPFEKPEDIKKVKGISDKIFELNKERIVIKDGAVEKKF